MSGRTRPRAAQAMHGRLAAAGLLAVAVLIAAATGCRRPIDLPQEMVGTWTTANATYADRSFTLDPASITFDLGENGTRRHEIGGVYRDTSDDGRDVYTIAYYGDGGLEYRYHLVREAEGVLVPESQPDLRWTRVGD